MINFTLEDLDCNAIIIRIQCGRRYIIWSSDEFLEDPVMDMMNMYNALKERKNAVWRLRGGRDLTFRTTFKNGDTDHVWLALHAEADGADFDIEDERYPHPYPTAGTAYGEEDDDAWEKYRVKEDIDVEEEYATEILMEKFETFFRLLLSSRFYPCQFPCWLYGEDDDLWDKAADAVDAAYPGLGYKEEDLLTRLYESEHQTLNAEGREFFKKFDTMLKTHKVPEEWQPEK